MDYQEDQLVEVNVVLLYHTDEAIKVEDADGKQIWLPNSALGHEIDEIEEWETGSEITISVRDSMARKKGLI